MSLSSDMSSPRNEAVMPRNDSNTSQRIDPTTPSEDTNSIRSMIVLFKGKKRVFFSRNPHVLRAPYLEQRIHVYVTSCLHGFGNRLWLYYLSTEVFRDAVRL